MKSNLVSVESFMRLFPDLSYCCCCCQVDVCFGAKPSLCSRKASNYYETTALIVHNYVLTGLTLSSLENLSEDLSRLGPPDNNLKQQLEKQKETYQRKMRLVAVV